MTVRLRPGPLSSTTAALLLLVLALHAPVFTRGALVTPAGMHLAQWPWKAVAGEARARGAMLEENPALSDLLFQVYPWQLYITRSLSSGSVPLWNPYSYCGVPFVANAQSAVFYPLHWPAWVFPSMRVFTIALLLKILLAGLFMAVFLRGLGYGTMPCVLGAVSFALCGFMTSWLGYAHTNAALLLPLLMHAARLLALSPGTGPFLLYSFASAAQYLGGHPETSLHIMGASALYFLWTMRGAGRPRLAWGLFALGGLLGFLMASVQTFPFIEYLARSAQLEDRRALATVDPSLPPGALMTLLVPGYYGLPWRFTYSGPAAFQSVAGYAGAGVLLLALMSLRWWREGRFFLLLAALSGAVVYGPSWIRSGLLRRIPLVGISSNNRLLLLVSFSLAALAALALHRILDAGEPRAHRTVGHLAWLALAGASLAATAWFIPSADPAASRLTAATVSGTALLLAFGIVRPPLTSRRAVYLGAVVLLTCLDMFLFAFRFNPHADPGELFPPTNLTEFIRKDSYNDMVRGGRLMTVGWTMRPEIQMVYRLSSIEGYDAMEFAPYRKLLERAKVASIHETGDVPATSRPLLNLLGLRYLITPPGGVVSGEQMTLAYDGPDGRVFVNERARPRFSFVDSARPGPAPGGPEALEILASSGIDLSRTVLLEPSRGRLAAPPAGSGTASAAVPAAVPAIVVERNAEGDLAVTVRGHGRPGYLVVADVHAPGWEARVNGKPAEVLRANSLFMAVELPPEDCEVALVYRPLWYKAGAWTSTLSLLIALALGLVHLGGSRES